MQIKNIVFLLIIFLLQNIFVNAQEKLVVDTSGKVIYSKNGKLIKDSSAKKYNPGIAIRRSAILPGWGQYTNKKYWKIPGICRYWYTSLFIYQKFETIQRS